MIPVIVLGRSRGVFRGILDELFSLGLDGPEKS